MIAAGPGGSFPAQFTYLNFGRVTQKGLELGIDSALNRFVNVFANYSWQGEPEPDGFDISELNLPPENRFNVGASVNYQRILGNLSVNYSGDAFWQDVLDARYHGTTEAYTLVNGGFGLKWLGDQLTTTVKVINLLNEDVQQHVFGDILKRQVIGEVRVGLLGRRGGPGVKTGTLANGGLGKMPVPLEERVLVRRCEPVPLNPPLAIPASY